MLPWILAVAIGLQVPPPAQDKIPLKVLYAGHRYSEFAPLLREHFTKVDQLIGVFRDNSADGYDVVILEQTAVYDPASPNGSREPELSERYDRATVLVGEKGVQAVRPLKLKLDWL